MLFPFFNEIQSPQDPTFSLTRHRKWQIDWYKHTDMHNTSAGTRKNYPTPPQAWIAPNHAEKRPSGGLVLFVGFRQSHVARLTKYASKETGNEGGTYADQQLVDSVAFAHVGEKRVKYSGKEIKGNLFSKWMESNNEEWMTPTVRQTTIIHPYLLFKGYCRRLAMRIY
jgi:hypothetical protein